MIPPGYQPQGLYYEPRGLYYEPQGLYKEPLGLYYEPGGPPSRLVKFKKKVVHFVCVLPTKVARYAPGLTRERRDDDYSP